MRNDKRRAGPFVRRARGRLVRIALAAVLMTLAPATPSLAADVGPGLTLPEISASVHERMRSEKRRALVIGNARYSSSSPLSKPVADADAVAAVLRHLDFDVADVRDAGKEAMKRAVEAFADTLRESGGVGLFYYSGHAVSVDGEQILIPVDVSVTADRVALEHDGFFTSRIVAKMENVRKGANLVFIDASRASPFFKGLQGAGSTKSSSPIAASGFLIGYASAPYAQAYDGIERSKFSVFTSALLDAMVTPGAEITSLFPKIVGVVKAQTKGGQTPVFEYSLDAPFHFIPSGDEK